MRHLRLSCVVSFARFCVAGLLGVLLSTPVTAQGADAEYMPVCNHLKCLNELPINKKQSNEILTTSRNVTIFTIAGYTTR